MRFDPFREIEELTQRMDRAFGNGIAAQTARLAPPWMCTRTREGWS